MASRRFFIRLAAAACLLTAAQTPLAAQSTGAVDVLDVSGPLDSRSIEWLADSIEASEAQLVVIQLDSPGAISAEIADLLALVAEPPVPVAVWVGPEPAKALGGAGQLVAAAPIGGAAPGAEIGHLVPTVAGSGDDRDEVQARIGEAGQAIDSRLTAGEDDVAFLERIEPSIGQLIVGLDGVSLMVEGEARTLATAKEVVRDDGSTTVEPVVDVRFHEPDLLTRTLGLATRPEGALFFLVAGIALGAFEFYAAGAGLMATVGIACLLLAGYGLSVLPIRWPAFGAVLLGLGFYAADFQGRRLGWRSLAGTALLTLGGLFIVDAAPQFSIRWWVVLLIVAGTALFFGIGMTAVVRARFSTRTIGREQLIGRTGTAATPLGPGGHVVVDGARWKASAGRSAVIGAGDPVRVIAVDGTELRVEPFQNFPGA